MTHRISIIDSHTGGEPTRVVVSGGPDLGGGSVADKLCVFREQHDRYRRAIVNEPRGSDVLVGAMLVEPADASCVTGVIYFDNVQFIGMCGHGTIGLVKTLEHMGRIEPGEHRIETPVGVVGAVLHDDGSVSVKNIPAYRKAKNVILDLAMAGGEITSVITPDDCPPDADELLSITGDVAWGGNWFFITEDHRLSLDLANVEQLTDFTWRIRQAVNALGFPEVDHIVLIGPAKSDEADARDFVLCPGKAYDRSPCGTGTSARLACLAADGRLNEGESWVVESVVGSRFRGVFHWEDREAGRVLPTITGTAHVSSEGTLLLDESDPFCWGIGGNDE